MLAASLAIGQAAVVAAAQEAVRLPDGEFAGEYWDVLARLESGHRMIVQAAITNLGPGDHNANVLGFLVDPSGAARRFKRSEPAGKWTLADGGRRVDLRSIALEPAGPERRFEVTKDDLGIDLRVAGRRSPLEATRSGACAFELLEVGAPASVRLRDGVGAAAIETSARVALTHRWSTALEADCVLRRVEVFVLEREAGVYFSETTEPGGAVTHRLVAERDGRVLFAGDPGEAAVRWDVAADGFAPPATARFAVSGLSGDVRFEATLASVDPIEHLPAPVRLLVATRIEPRLSWLRAPFEIRVENRIVSGEAIAKVTYSKPLPPG